MPRAPQLKDLIKEAVKETEAGGQRQVSYSPRTTSLSVSRAQTQRDAAEERFFRALDAQVAPPHTALQPAQPCRQI